MYRMVCTSPQSQFGYSLIFHLWRRYPHLLSFFWMWLGAVHCLRGRQNSRTLLAGSSVRSFFFFLRCHKQLMIQASKNLCSFHWPVVLMHGSRRASWSWVRRVAVNWGLGVSAGLEWPGSCIPKQPQRLVWCRLLQYPPYWKPRSWHWFERATNKALILSDFAVHTDDYFCGLCWNLMVGMSIIDLCHEILALHMGLGTLDPVWRPRGESWSFVRIRPWPCAVWGQGQSMFPTKADGPC